MANIGEEIARVIEDGEDPLTAYTNYIAETISTGTNTIQKYQFKVSSSHDLYDSGTEKVAPSRQTTTPRLSIINHRQSQVRYFSIFARTATLPRFLKIQNPDDHSNGFSSRRYGCDAGKGE